MVAGNSYRVPAAHMATSASMNAALGALAATLSFGTGPPRGRGGLCRSGAGPDDRFTSLANYLRTSGSSASEDPESASWPPSRTDVSQPPRKSRKL